MFGRCFWWSSLGLHVLFFPSLFWKSTFDDLISSHYKIFQVIYFFLRKYGLKIFRWQNRNSKYKTSVSTDVLEKVRKMNINISLWNMLAVALSRGSKRLNNFLKSFHWQTGSDRGCVSWELLLSAYSPTGMLNRETDREWTLEAGRRKWGVSLGDDMKHFRRFFFFFPKD